MALLWSVISQITGCSKKVSPKVVHHFPSNHTWNPNAKFHTEKTNNSVIVTDNGMPSGTVMRS